MPPASRLYTLVGFSPELDWRPLTFLKPIPANRICSACGLVRKRTALLPCMHVLCESCNAQCSQEGSNLCPVDGNSFEVEDVDLKEFPGDELLRREVKCWNEGNGCQYSTAASGISEHFLLECEHHSVHCTKCPAIVLCRDVRTHLRSASCNPSMLLQSDTAAKEGWAAYDSEKVYLRGYCMSPGVLAVKNEGPVALHARYILHVGDMDDAVQWPFQHKIRMSIVHPKGGTARVLEYEPPWGVAEKRPKVTSNRPRCSDDFFILEALLSEGYAEDDQLRIMWELVP
ncbi:uncharacterized protein LOC144103598 [Amblyomma americanum]